MVGKLRQSRDGGIGFEVVRLPGEEVHQLRVDEEFFTTEGHFAEHAGFDELLQVSRRRLAGSDAGVADILNPAVGLLEDQVDQFARVDLRRGTAHVIDGMDREQPDRLDLGGGPGGGVLDRP